MNGFLNVNCATTGAAFTRVGRCAAFAGTPKALILTPSDASFTAASDTAFVTALETMLKGGKAFAITDGIVNLEASGGETKVAQEGFGPSKANGWEAYNEVYTINKGGFCLLKQLLKVDGSDMRMFVVDDKDTVYGETVSNGTGIRGFKVSIGVSNRANNGTDTGAIRFSAYYSLDYFKEMTKISAIKYAADDILTLVPVRLMQGSASNKFLVVDSCSGVALDATAVTALGAPTNLEVIVIAPNGTVTAKAVTVTAGANELTTTGVVAGDVVALRVKVAGTPIGVSPLFFGVEDTTIIAS